MATINSKDGIKASVQLASLGEQAVIFTPKGQASIYNVIPKMTMGELYPKEFPGDTTVHPAFIINGKVLDKLYIGTYVSTLQNGELVSQSGIKNDYTTMQDAAMACNAMGAGHHILTMAELSLIRALSTKAGFNPFGADQYGTTAPGYSGIRVDGKKAGDTSSSSLILSGSGPKQFRHDDRPSGISDLTLSQAYPLGVRLWHGELQFLVGNAAANQADLTLFDPSSTSASWKALNGQTGQFVDPTFSGVGNDARPTTANSVRMLKSGTSSAYGQDNSLPTNSLSNAGGYWNANSSNYNVSTQALAVLKQYGLVMPSETSDLIGYDAENKVMGNISIGDTTSGVLTAISMMYSGYWDMVFGDYTTPNFDPVLSQGVKARACYYDTADLK